MTTGPAADIDEIDPEIEAEESLVVTHTTPTGQSVILSRAALNAYGEAYINQAALSSGKSRLVFADEDVLEDAQDRFPDSVTPLIDAYSDYLPDSGDFKNAINRMRPGRNSSEEGENYSVVNSQVHDALEEKIDDNSPAAISQPHGDAAMVVIPSPGSLESDSFKDEIIEGLSGIKSEHFGNMPGTSLDWAMMVISHEIGHLQNKDSDRHFDHMIDSHHQGSLNSPATSILHFRNTLEGEIRADISAARDFNLVTNGVPPLAQSLADIRIMGDFVSGSNIIDMGGRNDSPHYANDHNTGRDLQNYLETGTTKANLDQTQFISGYTNTLVRGLMGAVTAEKHLENNQRIYSGRHYGGPLAESSGPGYLDKEEFASALSGNDPVRIVSVGSQSSNPENIYAATKVLLDSGGFDHSPDAKQHAQRFVSAIERSAPDIINQTKMDTYREALANPSMQNFMEQLHRYNNPDQTIGYLYGGAAASPSAAPAPAPVM